MAKKKRITKYHKELVDPEALKQDIEDVITRLQELQTRADEMIRLKGEEQKVMAYGMPSWRQARDKIDAVAQSLLKSVGEMKKCLD